MNTSLQKAAEAIRTPGGLLIFTGAGISVESGIPSFRGQGGLWEQYDPAFIEIENFYARPEYCWAQIKKIFYDHWGAASPNPAHYAVAAMQKHGWVDTIVTQNIDALHQRAGARDVVEFHGTLDRLVCTKCRFHAVPSPGLLSPPVPVCPDCGAMLKPDFVFFGEGIPEKASDRAFDSAMKASAILVVGTSGEVMPACQLPYVVKRHGGTVIEVNPDESSFTRGGITDIFLRGKAGEVLPKLLEAAENGAKDPA